MSKAPIYAVWQAMVARTTKPNHAAWKNYGGRGITIAPEWLTFEQFYADMGAPASGMSLDRIDNNKGYCKANCRWATRVQQCANRRLPRRSHELL